MTGKILALINGMLSKTNEQVTPVRINNKFSLNEASIDTTSEYNVCNLFKIGRIVLFEGQVKMKSNPTDIFLIHLDNSVKPIENMRGSFYQQGVANQGGYVTVGYTEENGVRISATGVLSYQSKLIEIKLIWITEK